MKRSTAQILRELNREFIEGTIYRIDLDRVDVAPAGSNGILRSLPLTGDRDKLKPGDPVKILTVAGERIVLAEDVAMESAAQESLVDGLEIVSSAGNLVGQGFTPAFGVRVINTATQVINNATTAPLTFDTALYDTGGCWEASAATKLYARRSGYYMAGASWELAAAQMTSAARMGTFIRLNGTAQISRSDAYGIAGAFIVPCVASGMFFMSEGDYIEFTVFHGLSAPKTISAATETYQQSCNGWLALIQ